MSNASRRHRRPTKSAQPRQGRAQMDEALAMFQAPSLAMWCCHQDQPAVWAKYTPRGLLEFECAYCRKMLPIALRVADSVPNKSESGLSKIELGELQCTSPHCSHVGHKDGMVLRSGCHTHAPTLARYVGEGRVDITCVVCERFVGAVALA